MYILKNLQDILKIIKHININQSYILTSQGFWILSYQGYINEWEQYIEKLQKYLNAFYGFTNGGRQRTEQAEKWLKYTVGSGVKIITENEARKLNADYFFVMPYAFINEFKKRESKWLSKGGKFILPYPNFQIVKR